MMILALRIRIKDLHRELTTRYGLSSLTPYQLSKLRQTRWLPDEAMQQALTQALQDMHERKNRGVNFRPEIRRGQWVDPEEVDEKLCDWLTSGLDFKTLSQLAGYGQDILTKWSDAPEKVPSENWARVAPLLDAVIAALNALKRIEPKLAFQPYLERWSVLLSEDHLASLMGMSAREFGVVKKTNQIPASLARRTDVAIKLMFEKPDLSRVSTERLEQELDLRRNAV